MPHRTFAAFAIVIVIGLGAASAQTVRVEFPPDAKPLAPEALKERLAGKVFKVSLADGTSWRLEYRANGSYFVNTSRGFNATGNWRVEGSTTCSETARSPLICSEVRLVGDTIYLKRGVDPGEVLKLEPN